MKGSAVLIGLASAVPTPPFYARSTSLIFSNLPSSTKAKGLYADGVLLSRSIVNDTLRLLMYKDEPCVIGAWSSDDHTFLDLAKQPSYQMGAEDRNSWITVVPRGPIGSNESMYIYFVDRKDSSLRAEALRLEAVLVPSQTPKLARVSVLPGRLDPSFDPDIDSYHIRVPETSRKFTLLFDTVNDKEAKCTIDGKKWYTAHAKLTLKVPEDTSNHSPLILTCSGATGNTTKNYLFNVVRQKGGDTTLTRLGVLGGPFSSNFDPNNHGPYHADLTRGSKQDHGREVDWTQIHLHPASKNAIVTVDGHTLTPIDARYSKNAAGKAGTGKAGTGKSGAGTGKAGTGKAGKTGADTGVGDSGKTGTESSGKFGKSGKSGAADLDAEMMDLEDERSLLGELPAQSEWMPWFRVGRGEKRSVVVSVRTDSNPVAEEYRVILDRSSPLLHWYEKAQDQFRLGQFASGLGALSSMAGFASMLSGFGPSQLGSVLGRQSQVQEDYQSFSKGLHWSNLQPQFCKLVSIQASNGRSYNLCSGSSAQGPNYHSRSEQPVNVQLWSMDDLRDLNFAYKDGVFEWEDTYEPSPEGYVESFDVSRRRLIAIDSNERADIISNLEFNHSMMNNLTGYLTALLVGGAIFSLVLAVYLIYFFAFLRVPVSPDSINGPKYFSIRPDLPSILHPSRFLTFLFDIAFIAFTSSSAGILFCSKKFGPGGIYPSNVQTPTNAFAADLFAPEPFSNAIYSLQTALNSTIAGNNWGGQPSFAQDVSDSQPIVKVAGFKVPFGLIKAVAGITLVECLLYCCLGVVILSQISQHMTFSQQLCQWHDHTLTHSKAIWRPKWAKYIPLIGWMFDWELTSVAPIKSATPGDKTQAVQFQEAADHDYQQMSRINSTRHPQDSSYQTGYSANGMSKMSPAYMPSPTPSLEVAINDIVYNDQINNYDNRNAELMSQYPDAVVGQTQFVIQNGYGYPVQLRANIVLEHLTALMQLIDNLNLWIPVKNCQFPAYDAWAHLLRDSGHAAGGLSMLGFFDWAISRLLLFVTLVLATISSMRNSAFGFLLIAGYSFVMAAIRLLPTTGKGIAKYKRSEIINKEIREAAEEAAAEARDAETLWPFSEPGLAERFRSVRARKEGRKYFGMLGLLRKLKILPPDPLMGPDPLSSPANTTQTSTSWFDSPSGYVLREILFSQVTADILIGSAALLLFLSRRSSSKPISSAGLLAILAVLGSMILLNVRSVLDVKDIAHQSAKEWLHLTTRASTSAYDAILGPGGLFKRVKPIQTNENETVKSRGGAGLRIRRFPVDEAVVISNELGLHLKSQVGKSTVFQEAAAPDSRRLRLHKTLIVNGTLGAPRPNSLRSIPIQVPFSQLFKDEGAPRLNTEASIPRAIATIQIVNHGFRSMVAASEMKKMSKEMKRSFKPLRDETHDSFLSLYAHPDFLPQPGKIKILKAGHNYSVRYDPENSQLVVRGPALVQGRFYSLKTSSNQPSRQTQFSNALAPTDLVSDDVSPPSSNRAMDSRGFGQAAAFCDTPGALRVEIPTGTTPDLYKVIHVNAPTGHGILIDPRVLKVHYDPDCGEIYLRHEDLTVSQSEPYRIKWTVASPHPAPVNVESVAANNGAVYFGVKGDSCPDLESWMTLRDETGAVIDIDPKQTDAYQFIFPEKSGNGLVSNALETIGGRLSSVTSFLRGSEAEMLPVSEPIPCTIVQCVNPIEKIFRVDPDFSEASRVLNARVHEWRARLRALDDTDMLASLWSTVMTTEEYVRFWSKNGVSIVDEYGAMIDPLTVDNGGGYANGGSGVAGSVYNEKLKEIANGEMLLRGVLEKKIETRIHRLEEELKNIGIWIRGYEDVELYNLSLLRDMEDWRVTNERKGGNQLDQLSKKLQQTKQKYNALLNQKFFYPCNIPGPLISKKPNLTGQFRLWSDIIQSWLLYEEGINGSQPNGMDVANVIKDIMKSLKYVLFSEENYKKNRYASILHYMIDSYHLKGGRTFWLPDNFRAHTALVRIWPEAADGKSADFTQYPEWLPCLLRLTSSNLQILLPNGDDLIKPTGSNGLPQESHYPWQRSTGLYIPLHAFQKFEMIEGNSAAGLGDPMNSNPLLQSMTSTLICRKNQQPGSYVEDGFARRIEDDQYGNEICFTDASGQRHMRYRLMIGHCVPSDEVHKYPQDEIDHDQPLTDTVNIHPLTFKMNPTFQQQWKRAIDIAQLKEPHGVPFEGRMISTPQSPPSPQPQTPPPVVVLPPTQSSSTSSPSSVSVSESSVSEESVSTPRSLDPEDSDCYVYRGGMEGLRFQGEACQALALDSSFDGSFHAGLRHGQGRSTFPDQRGVLWKYSGPFESDQMGGGQGTLEVVGNPEGVTSPQEVVRFRGATMRPAQQAHGSLAATGVSDPVAGVDPAFLRAILVGKRRNSSAQLAPFLTRMALQSQDAELVRRLLETTFLHRSDDPNVKLYVDKEALEDVVDNPKLRSLLSKPPPTGDPAQNFIAAYMPAIGRWPRLDTNPQTGGPAVVERLQSGTVQYADETVYEGELRNGVPHGARGLLTNTPRGFKFSGQFVDGVPNGYGVIESGSGSGMANYYGTFEQGKRQGEGIVLCTEPSGTGAVLVKGVFEEDEMLMDQKAVLLLSPEAADKFGVDFTKYEGPLGGGSGNFTSQGGYSYEGGIVDGKRHGMGKIYNKDGEPVFIGHFKDDLPDGRCVRWVQPDGTIYCGVVSKGLKQGMGELYASASSERVRHGKSDRVRSQNMSGSVNSGGVGGGVGGLIYEGLWSGDLPHGRGTYYGPDGEYDGEWKNGKRSGKGRFVYKDDPLPNGMRRIYEGGWLNDVPHGIGKYISDGSGENVYRLQKGEIVENSVSSYKPFCGRAPQIKVKPSVKPSNFKLNFEKNAFLNKNYKNIKKIIAFLNNLQFLTYHRFQSARQAETRPNYDSFSQPLSCQPLLRPNPPNTDLLSLDNGTPNSQYSPPSYSQSSHSLQTGRNVIRVFVANGKELRKTDLVGKIEPYLKLYYGSSTKKTKPISAKPNDALFNKLLIFPKEEGIDKLKIEVWDADKMGKDDLIGEATVSLSKVFSSGEVLGQSVPLVFIDKKGTRISAGELNVNMFMSQVPDTYAVRSQSSQKSITSEELSKGPHTRVTVHAVTNINTAKSSAVEPYVNVSNGNKTCSTATGSGMNVAFDETFFLPWTGDTLLLFHLMERSTDKKGKPRTLGSAGMDLGANSEFSGELEVKDAEHRTVGTLDVSVTLKR